MSNIPSFLFVLLFVRSIDRLLVGYLVRSIKCHFISILHVDTFYLSCVCVWWVHPMILFHGNLFHIRLSLLCVRFFSLSSFSISSFWCFINGRAYVLFFCSDFISLCFFQYVLILFKLTKTEKKPNAFVACTSFIWRRMKHYQVY